jgi:hypothetical protein
MWNYRELLPVMAIMFLMADSPSFTLSFAAPCVSFILVGLLSKKAMQSACSLTASTSAWSLRMFTGPPVTALIPYFFLLSFLRRMKTGLYEIAVFYMSVSILQLLNLWDIFHEIYYGRNAWCVVDRASWYNNESTPTWYTFLSLFIKSHCLYMFRAWLAHLQEALHSCYLA